jgi:two-component system response regulator ChvI
MQQNAASLESSHGRALANSGIGADLSQRPQHVVVVDDDDLFRESLRLNLADEGFEVTDFPGGEKALDYFLTGGHADVLVLDWKMPGLDGLEVLRRLRATSVAVPVIFLTVLSDQIYEEAALAGGAVDFIEKSRSFNILLHRMSLITGGAKGPEAAERQPESGETIRYGSLQLRPDCKRAHWKGVQVDLTRREFDIVQVLAETAGRDVTYREIYDTVHGEGFHAGYGAEGFRANVRTFIKRIRRKFRDTDEEFAAIENFPGFGYRWRLDI